ncbi:hypothetical protein B0H14DRAFT_2681637 [Mycena olivaceomarginata]|nr:hypothetical protein B0H14DRAFT_2681637 [Mycena olivaceomarginata]
MGWEKERQPGVGRDSKRMHGGKCKISGKMSQPEGKTSAYALRTHRLGQPSPTVWPLLLPSPPYSRPHLRSGTGHTIHQLPLACLLPLPFLLAWASPAPHPHSTPAPRLLVCVTTQDAARAYLHPSDGARRDAPYDVIASRWHEKRSLDVEAGDSEAEVRAAGRTVGGSSSSA